MQSVLGFPWRASSYSRPSTKREWSVLVGSPLVPQEGTSVFKSQPRLWERNALMSEATVESGGGATLQVKLSQSPGWVTLWPGRGAGVGLMSLDALMQANGGPIKPGPDLSRVELNDLLPHLPNTRNSTRASCHRPVIKDDRATFMLTEEHKHDSDPWRRPRVSGSPPNQFQVFPSCRLFLKPVLHVCSLLTGSKLGPTWSQWVLVKPLMSAPPLNLTHVHVRGSWTHRGWDEVVFFFSAASKTVNGRRRTLLWWTTSSSRRLTKLKTAKAKREAL